MAPFEVFPYPRLLGWITLLASLASSSVYGETPNVNINGTSILGTSQTFENVTIEFFGGIPFAKPPLGDLRFAPPVETDSLGVATFDATAFGAACVQLGVEGVSEDCLTLNVFRPSELVLSNESISVPVMIWFYGEAFQSGLSTDFNASEIIVQSIQRGTLVIYVSFNYRVGPFGFPQGAEAERFGSLNLGLKDQLAAISWVQKHVSAFGGDPTKITLFGQSAGATSIADLYFNAGLENYGVRGAIMESGSAGTTPLLAASRRDLLWEAFAANTTVCTDAVRGSTFPCLRNATTSELLSSWEAAAAVFPDTFLFVPVIDGPNGLLPDIPSALHAAGNFSKIPFIAGTVLDEGTDFVSQQTTGPVDLFLFLFSIGNPYPGDSVPQFEQSIERLFLMYVVDPNLGSPFGTGNETFGLSFLYKLGSAIFGDVAFQAPRREWMQAATAAGVTAYGYMFADQNVAAADPSRGGALRHSSEVPYVYGPSSVAESNVESGLVSRAMVDYWVSFAVSGTPNDGKGLQRTAWPQYKSNNQVLVQFDTTKMTSDLSIATFTVIPDDYRAQEISSINSIAALIHE